MAPPNKFSQLARENQEPLDKGLRISSSVPLILRMIVKRYVRKLRGNQPLQPRAVILTGPGEESQVDYGTGAMVRDPQTRKYRRTRLFVMVLGCSRKAARTGGSNPLKIFYF
jgi:hypothetical protein